MKILYKSSLFILLVLFSNTLNAEINVATAANMKGTADLLVQKFNKQNKNIKVNVISASSGELFQQILNGAPFDIFISADTNYPQKLLDAKLVASDPYIYAYGKLIIVIVNNNIELNNIKDITNPKIKSIAIANPNLAPYGKVSMEVINKNELYNKVKSKIVLGNSLNQINQLIFTKAVDIAFTNKSVLVLDPSIKYYEIPDTLYDPIPQAIVLLGNNKQVSKEAQLFYDFIKSDIAKQIIISAGYTIK